MIAEREPLYCDVLVAGGGVAGLMAAIGAAEQGADVIVAEKANTRRSGCSYGGNDHFCCYIPEVHGEDPSDWIREWQRIPVTGNTDMPRLMQIVKESFSVVQDWEKWGVPMRPHGKWEFCGHGMPGHMNIYLKYAGGSQKAVLTEQAKKRGVRILNHMPFDTLLTGRNGEIAGGVCIDVSNKEPAMQVIRAKSVILCTGRTPRVYATETSAVMFNVAGCPSCAGAGMAEAYRAGARMVNMENAGSGIGCKYLNRGGKATWIGVYSDIEGKPLGPFVTKPSIQYGDFTGDIWHDMFSQNYAKGNPVFMNVTEGTDEDIDFMVWGLNNEGNTCTLNALEEEGFDFRKHMVEFGRKQGGTVAGIDTNCQGETSVPGLYAAGDEVGNGVCGVAGAAVIGRIAGRNAARYASEVRLVPEEELSGIENCRRRYNEILEREDDTATPDWKEMNIAIQYTMSDYCGGTVRSERLLRTGMEHLERLKKKAKEMHCSDSHTFMRVLEVDHILCLAELVMRSAMERKETRGGHKRADYPFANPLYDGKFVTIQLVDGKPEVGFRDQIISERRG